MTTQCRCVQCGALLTPRELSPRYREEAHHCGLYPIWGNFDDPATPLFEISTYYAHPGAYVTYVFRCSYGKRGMLSERLLLSRDDQLSRTKCSTYEEAEAQHKLIYAKVRASATG